MRGGQRADGHISHKIHPTHNVGLRGKIATDARPPGDDLVIFPCGVPKQSKNGESFPPYEARLTFQMRGLDLELSLFAHRVVSRAPSPGAGDTILAVRGGNAGPANPHGRVCTLILGFATQNVGVPTWRCALAHAHACAALTSSLNLPRGTLLPAWPVLVGERPSSCTCAHDRDTPGSSSFLFRSCDGHGRSSDRCFPPGPQEESQEESQEARNRRGLSMEPVSSRRATAVHRISAPSLFSNSGSAR